MGKKLCRSTGFTLLEVLIVTGIFLAVLTIATQLIITGTLSYKKALSDVKQREVVLQGVDAIASEFRSTLGRTTSGTEQGLDNATRTALLSANGATAITFKRQWGGNPQDTIRVIYLFDATDATIKRLDTITIGGVEQPPRGPFIVATNVKDFKLKATSADGGPVDPSVPIIDIRVVADKPVISTGAQKDDGRRLGWQNPRNPNYGQGAGEPETSLESKVKRRVVKEADQASAVRESP